jgi:CheY-like chemotaxis protein
MAHDILIVDDEADIRMLIAGILNDEGYSTREAADSTQALRARRAGAASGNPPGGARPAGCDDQRPWHDRDRGLGD